MNSLSYFQFVLSVCSGVAATVFVAFCIYQFHRHKHEHYFEKRHPLLIKYGLFLAFVLTLFHPISALIHFQLQCEILLKIRLAVLTIFGVAWMWLLMARLFLLNFDHQHNYALATQQWRQEIDPDETNVWLTKRRTFGNPSWLLIVSLVFVLPYATALAYLSFEHEGSTFGRKLDSIDVAFYGVVYTSVGLCLMSVTWMYHRLPAVSDSLHIRSEIRLCLLFFFMGVLVNLILNSLQPSFIRSVFEALIWMSSFPIWAFISTLYVIRMNSRSDEQSCIRCWLCLSNDRDSFASQFTRFPLWTKVARHPEGFEAFTNFLCQEFAVENMLFLTELMQFKQQHGDFLSGIHEEECQEFDEQDSLRSLSDRPVYKPFSVDLPLADLPFSKKVSVSHPNALGHAFYLFVKYIEPGYAPLEINIDYEARVQLVGIFAPRRQSMMESHTGRSDSFVVEMTRHTSKSVSMSNTLLNAGERLEGDGVDIREISRLLEGCGKQVTMFLKASFGRFIFTEDYRMLIDKHPELAESPMLQSMSPTRRVIASLRALGDIRV